jgi:hypothetical protein
VKSANLASSTFFKSEPEDIRLLANIASLLERAHEENRKVKEVREKSELSMQGKQNPPSSARPTRGRSYTQ